jgi:hypothetical protein
VAGDGEEPRISESEESLIGKPGGRLDLAGDAIDAHEEALVGGGPDVVSIRCDPDGFAVELDKRSLEAEWVDAA